MCGLHGLVRLADWLGSPDGQHFEDRRDVDRDTAVVARGRHCLRREHLSNCNEFCAEEDFSVASAKQKVLSCAVAGRTTRKLLADCQRRNKATQNSVGHTVAYVRQFNVFLMKERTLK